MTTYSAHSDRSGEPLPLAGGYSTPETARRACRKYFEADSAGPLRPSAPPGRTYTSATGPARHGTSGIPYGAVCASA